MKIKENTEAFPPYKYFTEVEDKFLNFKPNCRVLPARHFDDPQMYFTLRKRFEPGSPGFPQGGFEVIGPDGGVYNFYLNDKLIYQAIDTSDGINLNGQLFSYHDFGDMYLFLRAIIKTDTKLMGDYIATTETKLFDL